MAKAAAKVQVIQHISYYTENKHSYAIIGELQNTGDQAARVTSVIATIFNSKAEVLTTLTAYEASCQYTLLPGQKSPFIMGIHHYDILIENSRQISHYSVKAEFTQVSMHSKRLKILTHRGELLQVGEVKGDYKISGKVQYTGAEKAYTIRILATAYDSAGQIVAAASNANVYWEDAQTGLRGTIFEPNQIGYFEIYMPQGRANLVDSYSLTGEIPEYITMDGKVFPYYALDTGQAPVSSPTSAPVLPDNAI